MSKSVPKFTSFKQKPINHSTKVSSLPPQSTTDHEINEAATSDRHSREDPRRRHLRRARDHGSPTRSRQRHGTASSTKDDELSPLGRPAAEYLVDVMGDPKNLTYDSLHKYDVPRYSRSGNGRVVGVEASYRIDRNASTTGHITLSSRGHTDPTGEARFLTRPKSYQEISWKLIRPSPGAPLDLAHDFIPFPATGKRKRGLQDAAEPSTDHRDMYQKHTSGSSDGDDEDDTFQDPADTDESSGVRSRLAFLRHKLLSEPDNLETWETLIDRQTGLIATRSESETLPPPARKALAEMRLAIYDEAIPKVQARDRFRMVLGRLGEGAIAWNMERQHSMWRAALASFPSNLQLWQAYLRFVLASADYRAEHLKQTLLDLLTESDKFRQSEQRQLDDHAMQEIQLLLLVCLSRIMRDTGYHETATATWQGLMSLHLCHSNNEEPFATRLLRFREDWDSEVRRFGDIDTNASDGIIDDVSLGINQDTAAPQSPEQNSGAHAFGKFAEREHIEGRIQILSGNSGDASVDAETDEDVFHIVLFSDIEKYLSPTSLGFERILLVDAFLAFVDLPPMPVTSHSPVSAIRQEPWFFSTSDTKHNLSLGWQVSTLSNLWSVFAALGDRSDSMLHFLKNALRSIIKSGEADSTAALYYVAFLNRYFPKAASNEIKRLLQVNKSDMALYGAMACIQARVGRHEKAVSIWKSTTTTAVAAAGSSEVAARNALALIVHDWTWHNVLHSRLGDARQSLITFRGQQGVPSDITDAVRLGLEQAFTNGFETTYYGQAVEHAVIYASLAMLLAYLTSEDPIRGSTEVVAAQIAFIDTASTAGLKRHIIDRLKQAMHEHAAELISIHLDAQRPYVPTQIFSWHSRALDEHTISAPLLRLWSRLNSSVSVLDDLVKGAQRPWLQLADHTALMTWMSAIYREQQRQSMQDSSTGSNHALRSIFGRALLRETSSVRISAGLWRMWINDELQTLRRMMKEGLAVSKSAQKQIDMQTKQVKLVFFEGLRAIPWDRDWILLGLTIFDTDEVWAMDQRELRAVYGMLLERDFRIRKEIDEDLL